MGNPSTAGTAAILRMLPSTDDLLTTEVAKGLAMEAGRKRLTSIARRAIEEVRQELIDGSATMARSETFSRESLLAAATDRMSELWAAHRAGRLRKVINATGVVIHTNLGRAPLSDEAMEAVREASGYVSLEYDLVEGKRGRRGSSVEALLSDITGAEAALVVNNCAAAAFLVLSVFATGGHVIVSRGELVEIGGDFRIPDVLAQSGATLVEVGTTNRTKLADYERALSDQTRMIMRVHPSNYRIVGFTEKPSLPEISRLCRRSNVLLYEDAGSGALVDLSDIGMADEPSIGGSIDDGADIVTFSGDKLLGACQAGLIVGRRDLIEQIRKHPLYRALRADKLAYAALQATLEAYVREDAGHTVPVLTMLRLGKNEIESRARNFAARFGEEFDTVIELADGESVVGGGSAPAVRLETVVVTIRHDDLSAEEIEQRLRRAETPVIARIEDDRVLIDLRTVAPSDEDRLFEVVARVFRS